VIKSPKINLLFKTSGATLARYHQSPGIKKNIRAEALVSIAKNILKNQRLPLAEKPCKKCAIWKVWGVDLWLMAVKYLNISDKFFLVSMGSDLLVLAQIRF